MVEDDDDGGDCDDDVGGGASCEGGVALFVFPSAFHSSSTILKTLSKEENFQVSQ